MPQEQSPAEQSEEYSPIVPADVPDNASAVPTGDDALEFKPIVKYTGIGLALLLLAGAEYGIYELGYDRGYVAATSSGEVQDSVNAAAVGNLTHFMQMAVDDDTALLDTVKNRRETLAWIRESSVRREAEWTLAQTLIDRGLVTEGSEMLSSLIPEAPKTELWARRASLVAAAFAKVGQEEAALAYYRLAAGIYADLQQVENQIATQADMVELLAASPAPVKEVLATLDALQQETVAAGEAARGLRSTILAYMGSLYRRSGDETAALRCFEQALDGMSADTMPELIGAAVCYGMALLEKGETERAEKLLRDSVSRLVDNPAEISFQVSAMRELARIEQERGHADEALGLLYRAEGAAAGRIPADNPFWACLFDQRGWLNVLKQLYESAHADFVKAMRHTEHPDLLAQPLEGAGRCCLALGKSDAAVQNFARAAEIREQHIPAAKADLGRVYLLLGQAHDMAGQPSAAIEAYERAVSLLPQDSSDRPFAEMSLAYAYSQTGRWNDAYGLWSALQQVFADDAVRLDEIRDQLAVCRRHSSHPQSEAKGEAAEESPRAEDGSPTAQSAIPAAAPKKQRPRRRRR